MPAGKAQRSFGWRVGTRGCSIVSRIRCCGRLIVSRMTELAVSLPRDNSQLGGDVNISAMRRMAALSVIVGGGMIAGCSPPALGSGVAAMTPAEIDVALATISWTGCTTVARAAVPSGTTDVEICAAPNARDYGPRNPPPGLGAPVARMRNTGTRVEARWGLQPNGTYSIWLHSGTIGASYTIIGNAVNVTGTYFGCGHSPADSSRASFGTCADNPMPMSSRMGRNGFSNASSPDGGDDKGGHTLLDIATGPAWIACTEGCCTTDAQ